MSTMEFYGKFDSIAGLLHRFAYNLTKNMEDARDLYQETAFRAIKNKEKFNPGTNFKAWIMTIMKNIFINDYRKKMKRSVLLDKSDNNYFIDSGKQDVRNDANANILFDELMFMVDNLEDNLRVPFLMNYEGYKYQEIADELGLPLGTVKSRIFFARKELKNEVNKLYATTKSADLLRA